jgi:hypothetical protein
MFRCICHSNLPCRVVVRFSLIHLCDGLSSRFLKKLNKSYFKDPFDSK